MRIIESQIFTNLPDTHSTTPKGRHVTLTLTPHRCSWCDWCDWCDWLPSALFSASIRPPTTCFTYTALINPIETTAYFSLSFSPYPKHQQHQHSTHANMQMSATCNHTAQTHMRHVNMHAKNIKNASLACASHPPISIRNRGFCILILYCRSIPPPSSPAIYYGIYTGATEYRDAGKRFAGFEDEINLLAQILTRDTRDTIHSRASGVRFYFFLLGSVCMCVCGSVNLHDTSMYDGRLFGLRKA